MMSTDWMDDAACGGMDTNLFIPPNDDTPTPGSVKAMCGSCPVKTDCLNYSITGQFLEGVWGGLGTTARMDATNAQLTNAQLTHASAAADFKPPGRFAPWTTGETVSTVGQIHTHHDRDDQ